MYQRKIITESGIEKVKKSLDEILFDVNNTPRAAEVCNDKGESLNLDYEPDHEERKLPIMVIYATHKQVWECE